MSGAGSGDGASEELGLSPHMQIVSSNRKSTQKLSGLIAPPAHQEYDIPTSQPAQVKEGLMSKLLSKNK